MTDLEMIRSLLTDFGGLTDYEREAFGEMFVQLEENHRHKLTPKQRDWAAVVRERFEPTYLNLVSAGVVPRGREVPTPAVLLNLPKRPPPRRPVDDE